MQKFLFPLLVAVGLSFSAAAQSGPAQGSRPQRSPEEMAARQTKHLTKSLGLSAEQSAKVQQIMATRTQEMQALRADGSARPSREQMQANRAKYDDQLKQVLTPDQLTKYTAMQANRREHGPQGGMGKAKEGKVKIKTKPTDG
jgi:protein CpxP